MHLSRGWFQYLFFAFGRCGVVGGGGGGAVVGGDGCYGGARLVLAPGIRIIVRSTLVRGTFRD